MGGVKNDLTTSAVVLSFSICGMRANAVPASQKEQTRRYKEITAYTLGTGFSLLPFGVNDSSIPECHGVGSAFSFRSVAKSQNELQMIVIKGTVPGLIVEPLAYLQSQESQVNSFQYKIHPMSLRGTCC